MKIMPGTLFKGAYSVIELSGRYYVANKYGNIIIYDVSDAEARAVCDAFNVGESIHRPDLDTNSRELHHMLPNGEIVVING